MFSIKITNEAKTQLETLENTPASTAQFKAVKKALGYLSTNPKHHSLQTHEHTQLTRQYGEKIFEAYAQNQSPGAYRIFWHYGPDQKQITIIAITSHP